jgi:hypothetical protein
MNKYTKRENGDVTNPSEELKKEFHNIDEIGSEIIGQVFTEGNPVKGYVLCNITEKEKKLFQNGKPLDTPIYRIYSEKTLTTNVVQMDLKNGKIIFMDKEESWKNAEEVEYKNLFFDDLTPDLTKTILGNEDYKLSGLSNEFAIHTKDIKLKEEKQEISKDGLIQLEDKFQDQNKSKENEGYKLSGVSNEFVIHTKDVRLKEEKQEISKDGLIQLEDKFQEQNKSKENEITEVGSVRLMSNPYTKKIEDFKLLEYYRKELKYVYQKKEDRSLSNSEHKRNMERFIELKYEMLILGISEDASEIYENIPVDENNNPIFGSDFKDSNLSDKYPTLKRYILEKGYIRMVSEVKEYKEYIDERKNKAIERTARIIIERIDSPYYTAIKGPLDDKYFAETNVVVNFDDGYEKVSVKNEVNKFSDKKMVELVLNSSEYLGLPLDKKRETEKYISEMFSIDMADIMEILMEKVKDQETKLQNKINWLNSGLTDDKQVDKKVIISYFPEIILERETGTWLEWKVELKKQFGRLDIHETKDIETPLKNSSYIQTDDIEKKSMVDILNKIQEDPELAKELATAMSEGMKTSSMVDILNKIQEDPELAKELATAMSEGMKTSSMVDMLNQIQKNMNSERVLEYNKLKELITNISEPIIEDISVKDFLRKLKYNNLNDIYISLGDESDEHCNKLSNELDELFIYSIEGSIPKIEYENFSFFDIDDEANIFYFDKFELDKDGRLEFTVGTKESFESHIFSEMIEHLEWKSKTKEEYDNEDVENLVFVENKTPVLIQELEEEELKKELDKLYDIFKDETLILKAIFEDYKDLESLKFKTSNKVKGKSKNKYIEYNLKRITKKEYNLEKEFPFYFDKIKDGPEEKKKKKRGRRM